jgi:hypothetical protein
MAPSATTIPVDSHAPPKDENATKSRNTAPLKKTGSLDAAFTFDDVTPTIGREYLTAQIVEDILHAPNSDDLLRDLAITSKFFPPSVTKTTPKRTPKSANEASFSSENKTL